MRSTATRWRVPSGYLWIFAPRSSRWGNHSRFRGRDQEGHGDRRGADHRRSHGGNRRDDSGEPLFPPQGTRSQNRNSAYSSAAQPTASGCDCSERGQNRFRGRQPGRGKKASRVIPWTAGGHSVPPELRSPRHSSSPHLLRSTLAGGGISSGPRLSQPRGLGPRPAIPWPAECPVRGIDQVP